VRVCHGEQQVGRKERRVRYVFLPQLLDGHHAGSSAEGDQSETVSARHEDCREEPILGGINAKFLRAIWAVQRNSTEWHWAMPIIMPLLIITFLAIPVANILHRAGRSRWWTILAFIPLLNLIGLWVFAFTRWPKAVS
jgi:hypothetical protein